MIKDFIRTRLTRLGKIHLGEKARSRTGNEYPKDVNYFVVPEEVAAVYGDQPTELNVMVPTVNIEDWFPYSLKRYGADKLICRGDGEVAHCWSEAAAGWVEQECSYRECPHFAQKKCTEVGNLQLILPDVNIAGVYQIDTGSWHGINNVWNEFRTFLEIITGLTGEPRSVLGMTFKLTRELEQLTVTGEDGKRVTREKAILHLRPPALDRTAATALAARYHGPALPPAGHSAPALAAGDILEDEDDVVVGEILPDPDESQPTDLYPGAAPAAATLGQLEAWAASLERAQALGKQVAVVEKSVLSNLGLQGPFAKLTEDEAGQALTVLGDMLLAWEPTAGGETKPKARKAAPAPEPEPTPIPEPAAAPAPELAQAQALKTDGDSLNF